MTSKHFWLHHNCEVNVLKFVFNKTSNDNFSISFQGFQMRLEDSYIVWRGQIEYSGIF